MSSESRMSEFDTAAAHWLRKNKHDLVDLPEPGEEWRMCDTDMHYQLAKSLDRKGVVKRVGEEVRPEEHGGGYRCVYMTNPEAYERLQTYLEHTDPVTPCGHESFRNDPDGAMECLTCGSEFAKEEMVL